MTARIIVFMPRRRKKSYTWRNISRNTIPIIFVDLYIVEICCKFWNANLKRVQYQLSDILSFEKWSRELCFNTFEIQKRMHSSRMRTVRCSSRRRGVSAHGRCLPQCMLGYTPPVWTEWQTPVKIYSCSNYVADGNYHRQERWCRYRVISGYEDVLASVVQLPLCADYEIKYGDVQNENMTGPTKRTNILTILKTIALYRTEVV